jgi:hypothetical protein
MGLEKLTPYYAHCEFLNESVTLFRLNFSNAEGYASAKRFLICLTAISD